MPWVELASHRAWLDAEERRLLDFARAAGREPLGFSSLDGSGRPERGAPVRTYVTARMTHVFSLACLRGLPGGGALADHGVAALRGPAHDDEHGGWFGALAPDGGPAGTRKTAYEHAFVLLAASSAAVAGRTGAAELLEDAAGVVATRFWSESEGACRESWDRGWTAEEDYRGANSNMHMVEAMLAAADATGDGAWRQRALSIADRVIHGAARQHGWRLPEHFDTAWQPRLEYNADAPDHPFRPYGSTPGHWLEWSRLLLHLEAALDGPPGWLLGDARALFAAATRVGWATDGTPGFVYTLDWSDRPVVRARMHWVLAEAIAAAAALHRRTGEPAYEDWYRTWWDFAAAYHLDLAAGSWHHELDAANTPATGTWSGKPDAYHALQATLLPRLPLAPTLAVALRDRPLD